MPGPYFLNFDMKDVATFGRFWDSGGLIGGANPAFAPKNWGSNGAVPLGVGVPAYYFNGQNTGASFYPNDGSVSGTNLVAFSYTSDTDGLTPTANNDAINLPSAGGYTPQGIHFGRNRSCAVALPAGSLISNAGLITGFLDPTGMRAGGGTSANVISILKPFASGHVANAQGLIVTLNPTGQLTITVDFFNLPTVGGATVAQFRITGNLPGAPFPIYGFPIAIQWNFAGSIWKAQLVYALLGRSDGTYHYDTTTLAVDSTGASLTTANQGECNAGSALAPAFQLFNSSDLTHPMCLYFNAGPNAWLGDTQGSAYPAGHQPVQGSVYPPGTDVGFGAGLAPYHNVTFNYDCQFCQWMLTPQPQATVSGWIYARRER
jgi:hypothetical protein